MIFCQLAAAIHYAVHVRPVVTYDVRDLSVADDDSDVNDDDDGASVDDDKYFYDY